MYLFGFRKFIAPAVIKFFYYIGLMLTVFCAIGVILYAIVEMGSIGGPQAGAMIAGALIGAPIVILVLRFSTEMWLVLFEMNDRLGQIRDQGLR